MQDRFLEIFNLYKNDIYRLSYSYTKDIYDSDDVVQNVFVKLYNHKDIIKEENEIVKKWLIKVTINECKSLFLSSWRRKILPITEREENTSKTQDNNELLNTILNLDKKYCVVVYLYYYENYKVKEIANILKISETNVQTRLARAREQLKKFLKEDYYEKG